MQGNSIDEITIKSSGEINPKTGTNTRIPYEHQKNAMACLDIMNKEKAYSTLVVLPTGGGKTYTASMWLLKMPLTERKKYCGLHIVKCYWSKRQSPFRNLPTQK